MTTVHMNVEAAVSGTTKVLYRGTEELATNNDLYDFEVTNANVLLVNDGSTQYTIDEVFASVGLPTVTLVEVPGQSFDAMLFADIVAQVGITGYTSLVGGSGGTNGSFSLVLPAPATGGTQAVGTFTVAGGSVTALAFSNAGLGYIDLTPIALTNSAFAASTGLTGASVTLQVNEISHWAPGPN